MSLAENENSRHQRMRRMRRTRSWMDAEGVGRKDWKDRDDDVDETPTWP